MGGPFFSLIKPASGILIFVLVLKKLWIGNLEVLVVRNKTRGVGPLGALSD